MCRVRRWGRRLSWVGAALLLLTLAALAQFPELRLAVLFRVSPVQARDASLVRVTDGLVEVYLLGTLHGQHLSTPEYGLEHLKAALRHLQPNRLLVEARPEELARGRWGDGPLEMPYAALSARAMGIEVDGIDWWQRNDARLRRTDESRDDRIFANLLERLPSRGRVLVLVGFSHVAELEQRLEERGFQEVPWGTGEKAAQFQLDDEPLTYPPGMAAAIRQRIADAEHEATTQPAEVADELRALVESRRRFLELIERTGEHPPGLTR